MKVKCGKLSGIVISQSNEYYCIRLENNYGYRYVPIINCEEIL